MYSKSLHLSSCSKQLSIILQAKSYLQIIQTDFKIFKQGIQQYTRKVSKLQKNTNYKRTIKKFFNIQINCKASKIQKNLRKVSKVRLKLHKLILLKLFSQFQHKLFLQVPSNINLNQVCLPTRILKSNRLVSDRFWTCILI